MLERKAPDVGTAGSCVLKLWNESASRLTEVKLWVWNGPQEPAKLDQNPDVLHL